MSLQRHIIIIFHEKNPFSLHTQLTSSATQEETDSTPHSNQSVYFSECLWLYIPWGTNVDYSLYSLLSHCYTHRLFCCPLTIQSLQNISISASLHFTSSVCVELNHFPFIQHIFFYNFLLFLFLFFRFFFSRFAMVKQSTNINNKHNKPEQQNKRRILWFEMIKWDRIGRLEKQVNAKNF